MTNEDMRSEIDKVPFVPFRLHLVSGKAVDVRTSGAAHMLKNSVMVFHDRSSDEEEAGRYDVIALRNEAGRYDVIALRNIERLEQL